MIIKHTTVYYFVCLNVSYGFFLSPLHILFLFKFALSVVNLLFSSTFLSLLIVVFRHSLIFMYYLHFSLSVHLLNICSPLSLFLMSPSGFTSLVDVLKIDFLFYLLFIAPFFFITFPCPSCITPDIHPPFLTLIF